MQGKVCGKKRHTKTEIRSEISELICGRIAAGENYNLTRDNLSICFFSILSNSTSLDISSLLCPQRF